VKNKLFLLTTALMGIFSALPAMEEPEMSPYLLINTEDIPKYNFCYLEFSAFPTKIENNTFGAAIGYRVSQGPLTSSDYGIHVMRNACKEIIFAAKADHLFYVVEKNNTFSPYIGFGIIAGVKPEKQKPTYKPGHHKANDEELKDEYELFVNGEVVLGAEFLLNQSTRQFFELTYHVHSSTLQLSIGIGL